MARLPRLTLAGHPHHVVQRGAGRQPVFVDDDDRARYLAALREVAAAMGAQVHAYALMPDHVHLLLTPQHAGDVGRLLQGLGRRYVRWFNDRHRRTGALFEGRYRATVVDAERYLLPCMRHVELNPVWAGLGEQPRDYRWSSHRHHVGRATDALVTDHPVYWALGNTPFERQAAYMELFDHPPPREETERIRRCTHGGWLLGGEGLGMQVDRIAGRPTAPRRPGRPRKVQDKPDPN